MKVLITDGLSPKGQQILRAAGIDFHIEHYQPEELIEAIPEYDAVIVRSATKVTQEVIDAGQNLKTIARAGTGIDNIDHRYAESSGIPVLNAPGANSHSVAELVFAHLFALLRFIPQANITLRRGEWNKKQYKGHEIAGKTLGIIGFGRIGKITARLALQWDMKVVVYDIVEQTSDQALEFVSLPELLSRADFITLHVPKLKKPLITKREIGMMKEGVYLINCARGGVIDEDDLLGALNSGKIAGAGLDAFLNEPTPNPELVNHPKVSVTPHIGASTVEALDRVGIQIAKKVVNALT